MTAPQGPKVLTGTARVRAVFDVLMPAYDGITDAEAFADKAARRLSLRLTNAGFRLDEFEIGEIAETILDQPAEAAGD